MNMPSESKSTKAPGPDSGGGLSSSELSRRRFAGAGIAAPLVMSLASRPAFGAVCTPSGFISYSPQNPSGVRHADGECDLYAWSPGAWGRPYAGNGDGSFEDWVKAGYFPNDPASNPPNTGGGNNFSAVNAYKAGLGDGEVYQPSLFYTVFGEGPAGTMHDMLLPLNAGTLEFHAVAALLNASYGHPGYMSPIAVINLYFAKKTNGFYDDGKGTVIDMSTFDLKAFFDQTWNGP